MKKTVRVISVLRLEGAGNRVHSVEYMTNNPLQFPEYSRGRLMQGQRQSWCTPMSLASPGEGVPRPFPHGTDRNRQWTMMEDESTNLTVRSEWTSPAHPLWYKKEKQGLNLKLYFFLP